MTSEFAKRLSRELPEASFIGRSLLRDYTPRQQMIDAELQEVREVLEWTALRQNISEGGHCWCYKNLTEDTPHASTCQRARDLMEKLRV